MAKKGMAVLLGEDILLAGIKLNQEQSGDKTTVNMGRLLTGIGFLTELE
jgi:hypothetical protein